jgi:pimeloyl-ACP methyl ester carboxylesterase
MEPALVKELPGLPPGELVSLPGGRVLFARDTGPGPGPTLLLLHGLLVSGDLNWFGAFGALRDRFRVISVDLPGHGHSPAGRHRFRLTEIVDDVAHLARARGLARVVPVGYSMGGLLAQLAWLRHRDLVAGLVLCSTARNFRGSPLEQAGALSLSGLAAAVRLNPFLRPLRAGFLGAAALGHIEDPQLRRWAHAQLERTSLETAFSALDEVSRFTSHRWIGAVDVPTAVLVTTYDRVIPPARQRRLAAAIPGAVSYQLPADHAACITTPTRFAQTLRAACAEVTASGLRSSA